jgi:hypothetical protein
MSGSDMKISVLENNQITVEYMTIQIQHNIITYQYNYNGKRTKNKDTYTKKSKHIQFCMPPSNDPLKIRG